MGPLTIEGRWEDVRTHNAELAERQVRLVVLPESGQPYGEKVGDTGSAPAEESGPNPGVADEHLSILRETAAVLRIDFPTFMAQWKEEMKPKYLPQVSREELAAANARLFSHCINLGDPGALDNDRIDADLAREYGDNHEMPARPSDEG